MYAHKKGLKTTVTTNALNLKRKAHDLIDGRVDELFISLDGLEKTHNFIRGNNKSFQKAIEGIEYISSLDNAPEISVFCVITEWNYTELVQFANYFASQPIKHLGFMHQNFITEIATNSHNALYGSLYHATHSNIEGIDFSKIDLPSLEKQIAEINSKEYPFTTSFSPEINSFDKLEKYYNEPESKLGKTCNDVFTNLMIKTDGSIIPAHGRCYNVRMGNMYDSTIKEICNGTAYSKFRTDIVKAGGLFPACNRCCSAF